MKSDETKKSKAFVLNEAVQYVRDSVITRMIVLKPTGEVKVVAFGAGTSVKEKTSPFDTFIQVVDGSAKVTIENVANTLGVGQCIIIPAHSRTSIEANGGFKIMSTIIKSGYEDVNIV